MYDMMNKKKNLRLLPLTVKSCLQCTVMTRKKKVCMTKEDEKKKKSKQEKDQRVKAIDVSDDVKH